MGDESDLAKENRKQHAKMDDGKTVPPLPQWFVWSRRIVIVIVGLVMLYLADDTRISRFGFFADQATYYCMASSLAYDFDLVCEPKDIQRAVDDYRRHPKGLYLTQKSPPSGKWFFSKPWIYPAACAPWVRLFGYKGIPLFNALLCTALLGMIWVVLCDRLGAFAGTVLAGTCCFLSITYVYVFWMHPEIWNATLIVFALYMLYYHGKSESDSSTQRYGKILCLLACVASVLVVLDKPINFLLLAYVLWWAWRHFRWRWFLVCAGTAALMIAADWCIDYAQVGDITLRGGHRQYFVKCPTDDVLMGMQGGTNLPNTDVSNDSVSPDEVPAAGSAYHRAFLRLWRLPDLKVLGNNILLFHFGSFRGLLWHQTGLFLCFIFFFFSCPVRERGLLMTVLCVTALSWLVFSPDNWGGAHCLGNRYFMPMAHAAVFVVPDIRKRNNTLFYVSVALVILMCGLSVKAFLPIMSHPVKEMVYFHSHEARIPFRWGYQGR
jgi:hypothetical protein